MKRTKQLLQVFIIALVLIIGNYSTAYAEGTTLEYLVLGQSYSTTVTGYDYSTNTTGSKSYYFTPTVSGTYVLNAVTTGQASCQLSSVDPLTGYTSYLRYSYTDYDYDDLGNIIYDYAFTISYELVAGQTYCYTFSTDDTLPVNITFTLTMDISNLITWNEASYIVAKGVPTALAFTDPTRITSTQWTASDTNVVTVDSLGNVTGVNVGEASVTVTICDGNGGYATATAHFTITDPVMEKEKMGLNIYNAWQKDDDSYSCDGNSVELTGLNENSSITVTTSSPNILCNTPDIWYGETSATLYVYPMKKGDYTITVTVDGRVMTLSVAVRKLYFSRHKRSIADESEEKWNSSSMLVMSKGESITLKLKGLSTSDMVKYSSDDKTIATVSKTGKIKAKGLGETNIIATVGDVTLTYRVGVTTKQAVKALLYARKNFNSTYSQAKRMQKGFYDCSSFVWRSYQSGKTYVGPNKNWAPTAADMAKWCVQNGYMIFSGTADTSKMLPGDLIFETGANNGRYMGIYHVDMYQGNGSAVTVARNKWFSGQVYNVMIARPTGNTTTGLKAKKVGKSLTLTWTANYGANGYEVYRADSKNGKYKKLATVKKGLTSYKDTSVKKGKTYYYKVRAYWKSDKTFKSKFSSVVKKKY